MLVEIFKFRHDWIVFFLKDIHFFFKKVENVSDDIFVYVIVIVSHFFRITLNHVCEEFICEFLRVLKGDEFIHFTVDEQNRTTNRFDTFNIAEAIAHEFGEESYNVGCNIFEGSESRDEHETSWMEFRS